MIQAHCISWFNAFDILETLKKFEETGQVEEDQEMIDCKHEEDLARAAAIEAEREAAAAAAAAEAAAAAAEEEVDDWPEFDEM